MLIIQRPGFTHGILCQREEKVLEGNRIVTELRAQENVDEYYIQLGGL